MKKGIFVTIIMLIITIPSMVLGFASEIEDPSPIIPDEISDLTGQILGFIQYGGYAIAIGMLIYIGIKYMLSAANERAELKQSVINFVIGAAVIASASTIVTICVNLFKDNVEVEGGENETSIDMPGPIIGEE